MGKNSKSISLKQVAAFEFLRTERNSNDHATLYTPLGNVKLLLGDCIEVMRSMPDDSVDSIVTDPPYELGFMGKSWDSTGIAFNVEVWQEALRVLKPGGHLLAFSGSRTYHRMAVAIEDAGFQIRDQIMWVYGCLSEDTEILINGKWEHYRKAKIGDSALCYDVEHDTYQWQPIEDTVEYDYSDTAYRIHSDRTDQIVSKNHRCIVESNGKFTFRYAEALELQESVPILENLSDLLNSLSLPNQRTSNAKSLLFQRLYSMGGKRKEIIGSAQGSIRELYSLQEGSLETEFLVENDNSANLLQTMQWENQGYKSNRQQVRQNGDEVSWNWFSRRIKSSMERWSDLLSEKRKLQTNKVCSLPTRVLGNVTQRRIHNGTQALGGSGNGSVLIADRNSPSHQPRPTGQSVREFNVIQDESRPQTIRGEGFTITDLVRVEEVAYVGKIWCVKVPTGAFVARRNGMVFVTGNSGFPKSHNIEKAINKIDGVTFTERAKQWEGWGTALKPAHEPIVLARKPLIGTIANNVLAHGTGGLNIDGCRIEGEKVITSNGSTNEIYGDLSANAGERWESHNTGRFPANFIHDGSDEVLELLSEAARFFYCAKASKRDRNEGLDGFEVKTSAELVERKEGSDGMNSPRAGAGRTSGSANHHPTVKPTDLMRYLCKLITPPNGVILDPFMGSGSTGKGAKLEGFDFIGIEQDADYLEIARARIDHVNKDTLDL
jgi:DNA modification methylase